jgi:hypothetical protein
VTVYTGLLDEEIDVEPTGRQDLFLPPFLDRFLATAAAALVVAVLLAAGLLAAIAVRGAYGPQAAVAVLWPCWSAVLIGLTVRVLLVEPDPQISRHHTRTIRGR